MVLEITDQNFKEVLNSNSIVLVDFSAKWCGPCRMLEPIIEDLAKLIGDVIIGKINVDENPNTCVEQGVTALPTLIFFKNGEPVERLRGAQSKQTILKILERLKGVE